ncbi:MAG: PLD nuclease N-terminal domain-containing protein [Micromonosporaceae bacterium]
MVRLYLLFGLEIVLVVVALISCLSAEDDELRTLPRLAWIILIVLLPLVGAIVYFAVGRPVPVEHGPGVWRAAAGRPEVTRPRTLAPDDDPDFLRQLDRQGKREDEDRLKRWEADLRRREAELREREGNGRTGPTEHSDDA